MTSSLTAFMEQHRSTLVLSEPPTAAQTEAAVAVLRQARLDSPDGLAVSRALFELTGSGRPWHNDWLIAARDCLEAERKEKQRLWAVARNRTRDTYIGRLDRREEPTAEELKDWENWEWAMKRFEELTHRNEGERELSEDEPTQEESEEFFTEEIRDAYLNGGSIEEAAKWFYEWTNTGPCAIEAEFPGLWKAVIDECNEESD